MPKEGWKRLGDFVSLHRAILAFSPGGEDICTDTEMWAKVPVRPLSSRLLFPVVVLPDAQEETGQVTSNSQP